MGGASIEDCPQEVLLEIVKSLTSPYSRSLQRACYNLCLVKPFNPAATELLYHTPDPRTSNYALLLRTVLRHPELAALIRWIDVDGSHLNRIKLEPTKEDLRLFTKSVQNLRIRKQDQKRWIKRLKPSYGFYHSDALAALLLVHCPDIMVLSIRGTGDWTPVHSNERRFDYPVLAQWWEVAFPSRAFPASSPAIPKYDDLKTLYIHDFSLRAAQASIFFDMKSLRKLYISKLEVYEFDELSDADGSALFEEDTSNIQDLSFLGDYIHHEALASMIRACKALHVFSYRRCVDHVRRELFDYGLLSMSLQKHKHTLGDLELWNLTMAPLSVGDWTPFEVLHHLWIDADAIGPATGSWPKLATLMPHNLKYLCIANLGSAFSSPRIEDFTASDGTLSTLTDSINLVNLQFLSLGVDLYGLYQAIVSPEPIESKIDRELRDRGLDVVFEPQRKHVVAESWRDLM